MAAVEVVKRSFTTIHLYYDDTYLFSSMGKVLGIYDIQFNGENKDVVVLDQTVMHPQGGQFVYSTLSLKIPVSIYYV